MEDKLDCFSLYAHQVPTPPPDNAKWIDILRWLICVMDYDDTSLPFIAGLLSYCYKNGGLTYRQAKPASKVFGLVLGLYNAEVLYCQANNQKSSYQQDLHMMDAEGEA